MNTIKGLLKLGGVISAREMMELDEVAKLHLQQSSLLFKLISVGEHTITVKASQGKQPSEEYADTKWLYNRTQELFSKFLPEHKIIVQPVPFQLALVDVVDPDWIADKMLKKEVRIKDIQADTGINKTNLSAWIKGTRPMSQPVKAMFYYYFTGMRKLLKPSDLKTFSDKELEAMLVNLNAEIDIANFQLNHAQLQKGFDAQDPENAKLSQEKLDREADHDTVQSEITFRQQNSIKQ